MRLLIASHKLCWADPASPSGYSTDGGFGAQVGALATLFDETGLCVPVSGDRAPTGLTPLPATVAVHPLAVGGGSWRRRLRAVRWFSQIAREVRSVDAVHAPVPGDVGFLAVIVALVARKPLFVRHCGTWREPRTSADRLLRQILERSAGGRVVVRATGAGDGPPSTGHPEVQWIFSSSVREAELTAVRASGRRTSPQPGTVRVVTGGRLIPEKGADTVLEAFADLRRRGLVAHLDIVGDGPARSLLEHDVERLVLEGDVTFHGRLARDAVLGVFDRADLFVYPTRSSEGFPKLVLEALSRGLPVVATGVSAIPTMIDGAGVVVAPDPVAVADAAAALIVDSARFGRFQQQAVDNASCYTLEAWGAALGAVLAEAWGPLTAVERSAVARRRIQ